jgi:uncharacterized iron-regulated membrane protein
MRHWRRSFAFRWEAGGHRLRFDLHRSGGAWLFPLLLMIAVTSVSMNLEHEVVRPVVAVFSTLSRSPLSERAPVDPSRPVHSKLTLAQAVDVGNAEAQRRGWSEPAGGVSVHADLGLYSVGFFPAGGAHGDGGLGPPWLYIDSQSGAILGASVPGAGSAGDLFVQAMLPLHSGRILGTAGRALMSALGVAIATLSVTGVVIWARKRRAKAASKRHPPRHLNCPILS